MKYDIEDRGYETPCWVWQRPNQHGYGPHRTLYVKAKGPVPQGLWLDHLCRVRACVNPDHLEPVTPAENTRRGLHGKLSLEAIAEIERSSASAQELAERFGVSTGAIYYRRMKAQQALPRIPANSIPANRREDGSSCTANCGEPIRKGQQIVWRKGIWHADCLARELAR